MTTPSAAKNVMGVCPTQHHIIADMAYASREWNGGLPTRIGMSSGTWAALAADFFVARCPCPNCRPVGAMIIAGAVVEIDHTISDGRIAYYRDDQVTVHVEGYAFQA